MRPLRLGHLLWLGSVLVGCAATPMPVVLPDVPFPLVDAQAPVVAPRVPPLASVDLTYAVPVDEPSEPVSPKVARAATSWAETRATRRPRRQDFRGVEVRYPFIPGRLWAIDVTVHAPVHLRFDLVDGWLEWSGLDVGEQGWWEVKTQKTGVPPQEEGHLLVTAKAPGKSGKMTVLTGRGVYYLAFHSLDQGGMTAVRWQHPAPPKVTTAHAGTGVFYTGYRRSTVGPAPLWTPLGVWDTGEEDGRTLIYFPQAKLHTEAPQLWVIARDGARHLVPYTTRGRWYVVDQLFEKAELRLGADAAAEVILLERGPAYRGLRCPGDEACPPEGWSS